MSQGMQCSVTSVVSDSFQTSGLYVARQAPVQKILQARILEWVAMPSSKGSSRPRYQTCISYVACVGRWVLYTPSTIWEAPGKAGGKQIAQGTRGSPHLTFTPTAPGLVETGRSDGTPAQKDCPVSQT